MHPLPPTILLLIGPLPALAHPRHGGGGFAAGFLHPLPGPDHLPAMPAVGLRAALAVAG